MAGCHSRKKDQILELLKCFKNQLQVQKLYQLGQQKRRRNISKTNKKIQIFKQIWAKSKLSKLKECTVYFSHYFLNHIVFDMFHFNLKLLKCLI